MNSCSVCGVEIPTRSGRGRQQKTCSASCRIEQSKRSSIEKWKNYKACSVEGCEKIANRSGFGLCETHYYRKRRHGTTEFVGGGSMEDKEHSEGYVIRRAKGHPMAVGQSRAYVHRMVYFDAYGEGPFNCKWCGKEVNWSNLHIDHIDDDKKNNDLSNLAATCAGCNTARGHAKKMEGLIERRGIEFNGQKHTLHGWSKILGVSFSVLSWRKRQGWSVEKMLSTPVGPTGPSSGKAKC